MMVGRPGRALISRAVGPETVTTHQTAVDEQFERAVDSGDRHMEPLLLKSVVETVDREMIGSAHRTVEYRETLGCAAFMMPGEIVREDIARTLPDIFVVAHYKDKIKEFNPSCKADCQKSENRRVNRACISKLRKLLRIFLIEFHESMVAVSAPRINTTEPLFGIEFGVDRNILLLRAFLLFLLFLPAALQRIPLQRCQL